MIASAGAGVVVGLRWRDTSSSAQHEMFQVLRFRSGRVVDMQDFPDRRTAMKAIGAAA